MQDETVTIRQREMAERELRALTAKAKIENEKLKQFAAHSLTKIIVYVIAASYILYFVASPLASKYLDIKMEIPTEILSVLQAALFTLLGFLFGNKNVIEKSD